MMPQKMSIRLLLLFTELIMFGLLILICTCEDAPVNPYTCASSKINLLLRSSTLSESDLQIQDAPLKSFQMVANSVMTAYMDSIRFQLINDQNMVDKDTVFKDYPKSMGEEKITFNTALATPGVRIAKVTAYLNACQPIYDSATVIITNYPQNTKPEISVVGSTNILINSLCTLDVYATDLEQSNAQLVYTISDLPENASFVNQRFIWKPAQAGTYTITFKVTDNGIPPLTSQIVKTLNVVTLIEKPSKPLSLAVISRDQSTVGLKWKRASRADSYGVYRSKSRTGVFENLKTIQDTTCKDTCSSEIWYYFVSAKNTAGEVSSDTIAVPLFDKDKSIWNASTMSFDLQEGEACSYDLRQLCKSDIQNVIYTLKETAPLHDTLNGTSYEYNPSFNDSGTYTVQLTAVSGTVSEVMTFEIHVKNVNRAPMFQANMPPLFYFIPSSNQLRIPVKASDPDGDIIRYTIKSTTLPRSQELLFNSTNDTLLWTKTLQDNGTYSIILTASDKEDSADVFIQVYSEEKALKPTWKSNNLLLKVKEAERCTVSLADSCQDPNGDKVSFELVSSKVDFDTIIDNSLYVIAPAYKDSGDYNDVRIVASDGTLTDTLHISVGVLNVNRPPVIKNVSDITVLPQIAAVCTLQVEDPDSNAVSMSVTLKPSGATFDPQTGIFSWLTPSNTDNRVIFAASDGYETTTKEILITVSSSPLPKIIQQPRGDTVCSGVTCTLNVAVENSDGIKYQWRKNNNELTGAATSQLILDTKSDTVAGLYTCALVNNSGSRVISDTARIHINIQSRIPVNAVTASPAIICNGSSTLLKISKSAVLGTGADGWYWFSDRALTTPVIQANKGDSILVVPAKSGKINYYVRASGSCNQVVDSVEVTVVDVPSVPSNLKASKDTIEAGDSTVLSATAANGVTLKWFIGKCDSTVLLRLTVAPLSTTTYYVRAENGSCYSECGSKTITVKNVDVIKPSIKISDPPSDMTTSATSYSIKVLAKDASGIKTVMFKCGTKEYEGVPGSNDSTFTAAIDLVQGTNKITAVAIDKSINANRDSASVTITSDPTIADKFGPVISKATVVTSVNIPNVSISCTIADDSNVDTVQWSLNNGAWQNVAIATDNKYLINATLPAYHTNKIIIRAVDKSSNKNDRSDTTVFDYNVAPKVKDTAFSVDMNASKTFTLYADPVDGDALTGWTILSGPKSGALSGTAPSLSYKAASTFTPYDTITYSVKDAGGNISNTGKVIISINDTRVAPKIGTQPVSPGSVCASSSVSMSVTVTQGNDLIYVWKRGSTVVGLNSPTLSISSVTAGDTGSYTVTVSNSKGSETSTAAKLSLIKQTTISSSTTGPVLICQGSSTVLSVVADGSNLKYQWMLNGTDLTSGTSASYTATVAGTYVCEVNGDCGTGTTNPVIVQFNVPPVIKNQPEAGTQCANTANVFRVTTDTITNYNYQWLKDGVAITDDNNLFAGAKTSAITVQGLAAQVGGYYSCNVTRKSTGCSIESTKALFTVAPGPVPTPTTTTPAIFTVNEGASITLNASIASPYTIEWVNSAGSVVGTGPTFNFIASQTVTYTMQGVYPGTQCRGPSISRTVTVVPISKVTAFTSDQPDFTACVGTPITVSVPLEANMTYSWVINGTEVVHNSNVLIFNENANAPVLDGMTVAVKIMNSNGHINTVPTVTLVRLARPEAVSFATNDDGSLVWGETADADGVPGHRWITMACDCATSGIWTRYNKTTSDPNGSGWSAWTEAGVCYGWPDLGPNGETTYVEAKSINVFTHCESTVTTATLGY